MNLRKTTAVFSAALMLTGIARSQTIQTSISIGPTLTQSFGMEKTNMTLNPVTSYGTSGTEAYYYAGGPGYNYNFLMSYNSYKYDHTGIANSDISNISYSFGYNAHYDINHPTNNYYWAYSNMYVTSPLDACNSNWSTATLLDCVNRESCITNGNYLAYVSTGGQPSNVPLTWSQNISSSSNPNLNAILQNPNDFTIAFMPDGNTTCYMDINAPTVVITYNTYPIANNVISGDQSFTGSGDPALLTATTPTGGNRNQFTYQWQKSTDNLNWSNISGAVSATYDPPTLTQSTYYRRVVSSSPQSPSVSNVVTITITTTIYPLTPTGLSATGTSASSVFLSWNASLNATSYDVYSCSGTFIGNSTSTNYTHTGLSPLTTYSYKIIAKNIYGVAPPTGCVNGTTQALTPPVPTGFKVSVLSSNALHLAWNGMSNTTNYNVEVWDYSGNRVFQKTVTANSCIAFGLSQSTNYRCYVWGNNSYGSSSSSMVGPTQTGALINDPSLFFNVTGGTEQSTSMSLGWGIQSNTTRYSIYKCDGTFIGDSYTPSFTHTGLTANTIYDYYVVAVNIYSSVYRSSGYCFSFATRRTAPTGFTGIPLNCTQLKLSWTPYPGSPTYYLYDCSGNYLGSTTSTDYLTTVASGNSYSYQLMAANSSWSNVPATEKSICLSYNPSTYRAFLSSTSDRLCPGIPTSVISITNCNAAATTYQWQSSICGSAFQDISGANGSSYVVTSAASTGTSFRAKLISNSTMYYSDVKVVSSYNVCNPSTYPACGGSVIHFRKAIAEETAETNESETKVYPNPATNNLTIELYNAQETHIEILIYDALGKAVCQLSEDALPGDFNKTIDVSSLAKGIYYVKVNHGGYQTATKIIKD